MKNMPTKPPEWNGAFKYRIVLFDNIAMAVCIACSAMAYATDYPLQWWWPLAVGLHIFIAGFNGQRAAWYAREARDWRYLAESSKYAVEQSKVLLHEAGTTLREARGMLEQLPDPKAKDIIERIKSIDGN